VSAVVARVGTFRRAPSRTGNVTASVARVRTAVRALSRSGAITATLARLGTFSRKPLRAGSVLAAVGYAGMAVGMSALTHFGQEVIELVELLKVQLRQVGQPEDDEYWENLP